MNSNGKPPRRLLDLDAMAAEAVAAPLDVKLRGSVFTLPPVMPVGLPIFLSRAFDAATVEEENQAVVAAMESLFGDRAEEAMRAGFTIAHLVEVNNSYGVQAGGGDPEASAGASPASAPSSKPAGSTSRRPSKRSTASTSPPAVSEEIPSGSAASRS